MIIPYSVDFLISSIFCIYFSLYLNEGSVQGLLLILWKLSNHFKHFYFTKIQRLLTTQYNENLMTPFSSYFKYLSLLRKEREKRQRGEYMKTSWTAKYSPPVFCINMVVLSSKSKVLLPSVFNTKCQLSYKKPQYLLTKVSEFYWLLRGITIWEDILLWAGSDALSQQLFWGTGL